MNVEATTNRESLALGALALLAGLETWSCTSSSGGQTCEPTFTSSVAPRDMQVSRDGQTLLVFAYWALRPDPTGCGPGVQTYAVHVIPTRNPSASTVVQIPINTADLFQFPMAVGGSDLVIVDRQQYLDVPISNPASVSYRPLPQTAFDVVSTGGTLYFLQTDGSVRIHPVGGSDATAAVPNVTALCPAWGHLYLGTPQRGISEVDPVSGALLRSIPSCSAVAEITPIAGQRLLGVCSSGEIDLVDLSLGTSQRLQIPYPSTGMASSTLSSRFIFGDQNGAHVFGLGTGLLGAVIGGAGVPVPPPTMRTPAPSATTIFASADLALDIENTLYQVNLRDGSHVVATAVVGTAGFGLPVMALASGQLEVVASKWDVAHVYLDLFSFDPVSGAALRPPVPLAAPALVSSALKGIFP